MNNNFNDLKKDQMINSEEEKNDEEDLKIKNLVRKLNHLDEYENYNNFQKNIIIEKEKNQDKIKLEKFEPKIDSVKFENHLSENKKLINNDKF